MHSKKTQPLLDAWKDSQIVVEEAESRHVQVQTETAADRVQEGDPATGYLSPEHGTAATAIVSPNLPLIACVFGQLDGTWPAKKPYPKRGPTTSEAATTARDEDFAPCFRPDR
jgi:hypothetical protein